MITFAKDERKLAPADSVRFEVDGEERLLLSRQTPLGSFVHVVRVKPVEMRWADGQRVHYSIDASPFFSIDPQSGKRSFCCCLFTCSPGTITTSKSLLDAPSSTNLTVTATNEVNGAKSRKLLRVEVADDSNRPPTFEREFFEFEIPENAAAGRLIGVVGGGKDGVHFELPKEETKVGDLLEVSKNVSCDRL